MSARFIEAVSNARRVRRRAWLAAVALALLAPPVLADRASDAPEARDASLPLPARPASHADALARWRDAQDMSAWAGAYFEYDMARALALSESERHAGRAPAITEPARFFEQPRGVCVDLARFGLETLQVIAPQTRPRYLMIEFDPLTLQGRVLRRHWLVVYEQGGQLFFTADSKRPGAVAGPYPDLASFIADYAAYRDRGIVAHREADSLHKQARATARQHRLPAPP
ncbi:MAG: hypothetical protein IBJ14_00310 [Hydrogenophaga sp.]|nr:hypothetical protein [Hydrogenophaga sp.]